MRRNIPVLFLLLTIPIGLTYFLVMSNADYLSHSFETVDLNVLIFRWYTIFHIVWGISVILTALFYIEMILVRKHLGYMIGIPLQFGACVVIWMFSLFNGHVLIHETYEIKDRTYHLVEITYNATGRLHIFTCDESMCDVERVAFIDSQRFRDASMTYDESNHRFNIWTDDGTEVEEIEYPLE